MESVHDFVQWREELASFEHLGLMWRRGPDNVLSGDGRAAPVDGAEFTALIFSLLGVQPLLGRPLIEADEAIGARAQSEIGFSGRPAARKWRGQDQSKNSRHLRASGLRRPFSVSTPEKNLAADGHPSR